MKEKLIITGLVIALGLGVFGTVKQSQTVVVKSETLGSVASPDSTFKYIGVGGIRTYFASGNLTTATTTVCSLVSPAATSTLQSAGITLTTSSTTASTVRIARAAGTNNNASTTVFAIMDVAANAQAEVIATSTMTNTLTDRVVKPNSRINFSMSGGVGTFSPVGVCHATFEAYK